MIGIVGGTGDFGQGLAERRLGQFTQLFQFGLRLPP